MSTNPYPAGAPLLRTNGGGMNLGDSVYERLLRERIIFLGTQVDDVIANQLAAQMLLLSAEASSSSWAQIRLVTSSLSSLPRKMIRSRSSRSNTWSSKEAPFARITSSSTFLLMPSTLPRDRGDHVAILPRAETFSRAS